MNFEEAYAKFCEEGKEKFILRSERHPEEDVIRFGSSKLDLSQVKGKFFEELKEFLDSDMEDPKEAVDVHNVAFLLWWVQEEKV